MENNWLLASLQALLEIKDRNKEENIALYNLIIDGLSELAIDLPPTCKVYLLAIEEIEANTYNPNSMALPESRLLKFSIEKDGMTMPILVNKLEWGRYIIIDGFHRFELLKSNPYLQQVPGYVPAAILNKNQENCISSSVRHNIARGMHQVELTAKLVMQLKENNWTNKRLCNELGMDMDELLRMQQITGLAMAFKDQDFSQAWE